MATKRLLTNENAFKRTDGRWGGSEYMETLWNNYKKSNSYVGDISWNEVLGTVTDIVLDQIKYGIEDDITEEEQIGSGYEMTIL